MITTLRTKMLIGVTPLLALMVGLGIWAITLFSRLGNNIDVILRENYRSVLAAQGMKESLERMDSALWFAIGGKEARAREQYRENRKTFGEKLRVEQNNVTLPGEQEMSDDLTAPPRPLPRRGRPVLRPPARGEGGADCVLLRERHAAVRGDQAPGRRRARHQPEEHDGRERPGPADGRVVDPPDALRPARLGGAGLADRDGGEPGDPRADPRGDPRRPGRWRGATSTRSSPSTTRDELGELAEAFNEMARTIRELPPGRDRPAAPRPADGAGDDRLVPRPGRRGRPDRLGRAGQPGGPSDPRRGHVRRPDPLDARRRSSASRWPRSSAARLDRRPIGLEHAALRTATTARSGSSCRTSWRSATKGKGSSAPRSS